MKTWKKILLTICIALLTTLFAVGCNQGEETPPPTACTIAVEKNIAEAGEVTGGGTYERLSVATLSATTEDGYVFVGWYDGETLLSTWRTYSFQVKKSLTITAKWQINSYVVTFDTDGGSSVAPQTVQYGDTATTPTAPTKTGYTFAGWDYDFNTPITGNTTIVALWTANEYTVTFKVDGATHATQKVVYNATASAPTTPTKAGQTFSHWSLTEGGSEYAFTTAVTDDLTLYAVFNNNSYTLTVSANPVYNGNTGEEFVGGTVTGGGLYEYGTEVTLTATPSVGCEFLCWSDGETDATRKVVVTESTEYRATFRLLIYNVVVDSENDDMGSLQFEGNLSLEYGTPMTLVATPNTGYLFDGWYEDGELVSSVASYEFTVESNRNFVAKWKAQEYTVAFDTDGGNAISAQTVEYGKKAQEPADPTKTGYTFAGWNFDFNVAITGDTTIKATWTINEYTVTFKVDGATHATQKVVYNGTASVPTVPTATGKTFSRWSLTEGGSAYDFTAAVTGDLTLYAVFDTKTYALTVNASEGGEVTGDGTYEHGTEVTLTATAQTGYVFAGWSDGNMNATRTVTVDSAYTLTATFMKKTYTVSTGRSPDAGGTVTGGGTYEHGDSVTLKATTNSAYNFLGWYDGNDKTSDNEMYTFTATEDKTYTAKWEEKTPVTTTIKDLHTAGKIKILGRTLYDGNTLVLRNSATGFEIYTTSSYLKMSVSVSGLFGGEYMNVKVWVDGTAKVVNLTSTTATEVTLAENMTAGEQHHIKLAKMNEALGVGAEHADNCNIYVQSLTANYDGEIKDAPAASDLKIEIYGDSITCGYGALGNVTDNPTTFDTNEEDATETFAYKTAMALGADLNVVAHQGWAIGQSRWGTTEKPLTLPAIYDKVTDAHEEAWDFSSYTPDIVIVSLGTNDQVNSGSETIGNDNYTLFCWQYLNFLVDLHEKYPNAKFVLCYGMMDVAGGPMEDAIANWLIAASKTPAAENYPTFSAIAVDLTGADGTYMSGGGSHPSAAQHTVAATNLQTALRDAGWI